MDEAAAVSGSEKLFLNATVNSTALTTSEAETDNGKRNLGMRIKDAILNIASTKPNAQGNLWALMRVILSNIRRRRQGGDDRRRLQTDDERETLMTVELWFDDVDTRDLIFEIVADDDTLAQTKTTSELNAAAESAETELQSIYSDPKLDLQLFYWKEDGTGSKSGGGGGNKGIMQYWWVLLIVLIIALVIVYLAWRYCKKDEAKQQGQQQEEQPEKPQVEGQATAIMAGTASTIALAELNDYTTIPKTDFFVRAP